MPVPAPDSLASIDYSIEYCNRFTLATATHDDSVLGVNIESDVSVVPLEDQECAFIHVKPTINAYGFTDVYALVNAATETSTGASVESAVKVYAVMQDSNTAEGGKICIVPKSVVDANEKTVVEVILLMNETDITYPVVEVQAMGFNFLPGTASAIAGYDSASAWVSTEIEAVTALGGVFGVSSYTTQANTLLTQTTTYLNGIEFKALAAKAAIATKLFDYQDNCFDKSIYGSLFSSLSKAASATAAQMEEWGTEVLAVLKSIETQIEAAIDIIKTAVIMPLIDHINDFLPDGMMDGDFLKGVQAKFVAAKELIQGTIAEVMSGANDILSAVDNTLDAGTKALNKFVNEINDTVNELVTVPIELLQSVVPCLATTDSIMSTLQVRDLINTKAKNLVIKNEADILLNGGYNGVMALSKSLEVLSKDKSGFFTNESAKIVDGTSVPKLTELLNDGEEVTEFMEHLNLLTPTDRLKWSKMGNTLKAFTAITNEDQFESFIKDEVGIPSYLSLADLRADPVVKATATLEDAAIAVNVEDTNGGQ